MVGNYAPPPDYEDEPSLGASIISGCAMVLVLTFLGLAIGGYVVGSILNYW